MNWDYISGYFDGEGSAYITNQNRAYLTWANTNLESLETMKDFMGVGNIRQSHKGERSWYTLAVWRVDDLRKVVPELQARCIIKLPTLTKVWEHSKDKVAKPQKRRQSSGTTEVYDGRPKRG